MKILSYLDKISISGRVPIFWDVPSYMCSMYARQSAEALFGLKYNPADAWDFRYQNRIIWNSETDADWKRVVKAGHILGIFYPASVNNTSENGEKDSKGNDRLYTHLILYAGNGAILHQFGSSAFASDLKRFLDADFRLVEIITPPRINKKKTTIESVLEQTTVNAREAFGI